MKVRTQEFVNIWQGATCLAEVARKTGYKSTYCSQRACRLRANGKPLKRFHEGASSIDSITVPTPEEAMRMIEAGA